MIFKIKTKKDKRIEELEREVFMLRPAARQIIRTMGESQRLTACVSMDFNMSAEHAKRILAEKLVEKLVEDELIRYDIVDDGEFRKLCGDLIVMKREY